MLVCGRIQGSYTHTPDRARHGPLLFFFFALLVSDQPRFLLFSLATSFYPSRRSYPSCLAFSLERNVGLFPWLIFLQPTLRFSWAINRGKHICHSAIGKSTFVKIVWDSRNNDSKEQPVAESAYRMERVATRIFEKECTQLVCRVEFNLCTSWIDRIDE